MGRIQAALVGRWSCILVAGQLALAAAVEAQQTPQPVKPDRPDNLWQPVAGDYAAHGRFDDRSRGRSPELWASLHRGWLAAGAAGMAALALAAFARVR